MAPLLCHDHNGNKVLLFAFEYYMKCCALWCPAHFGLLLPPGPGVLLVSEHCG